MPPELTRWADQSRCTPRRGLATFSRAIPRWLRITRLVLQAVERPITIRYSATHRGSRKYIGAGPRRGLIMVVVADINLGLVKTAYLARRASGDIEWS